MSRLVERFDEASSTDDDDEEDEDEDESQLNNDARREKTNAIETFDDLPSDDSVSLSDSSDGEDDGEDDDEEDEEDQNDDDFMKGNEEVKGISLEEKLKRKDKEAVFHLKQRRDRRTAALEKAKEQLRQHKMLSDSTKSDKTSKSEVSKRSKHAPTEMSSKRKDFFKRGAPILNSAGIGVELGAHRYKPRDPRMCTMSGHLQEDHFEHHYAFLDDLRKKEIEVLQRRIDARKLAGRKGQKLRKKLGLTGDDATAIDEDQDKLRTLKQQITEIEKYRLDRSVKRGVKRKIKEEIETGKRGISFVKRSELKRLELEAKYEALSKQGNLEKILARKRKKNKTKDAVRMA
jgi:ribosomal RNA-processing protein 36